MIYSLINWIQKPLRLANDRFAKWNNKQLSENQTGLSNSQNRDKWVGRQLGLVPVGLRLLDAGAGEQPYRKHCMHLRYVSQDHEAYDGLGDGLGGHIEGWTYGKTDVVCDISKIPEADSSFDAILCTEVLEHVPDPVLALAELARLTRPGGRMILSTPFVSFTHFAPYHFCTGLSRYWYEHHLSRLGFTNIVAEPNGNFFEFLAQEIRRLPHMAYEYSAPPVSGKSLLASIALLTELSRQSDADRGSSAYACYGWHVTANKKP